MIKFLGLGLGFIFGLIAETFARLTLWASQGELVINFDYLRGLGAGKNPPPVAWYDGNKFFGSEEAASMCCADMKALRPVSYSDLKSNNEVLSHALTIIRKYLSKFSQGTPIEKELQQILEDIQRFTEHTPKS